MPNFTNSCTLAVARSSYDGVAIRYVLPVLRMTSCSHTMGPMGRLKHDVMLIRVRQVAVPVDWVGQNVAPGAKSVIILVNLHFSSQLSYKRDLSSFLWIQFQTSKSRFKSRIPKGAEASGHGGINVAIHSQSIKQ